MNCRPQFSLLCVLLAVSSCHTPLTYAAHCSRPLAHWKSPSDGYGDLSHNDVVIGRNGELSWNGIPISRKEFDSFLAIVPTLDPQPDLILMFDPDLDCKSVIELRNLVDKKLDCQGLRRCGEGDGDWRGNTHISHIPSVEAQAEMQNFADEAVERAQR